MTAYILNTIAFKSKLSQKVSQADLVAQVKKLGFDGIEIRSEYLTGNDEELKLIAANAKKSEINIYYSVNDILFSANGLNSKIKEYLFQMKTMGSKNLKLNLGPVKGLSKEEIKASLNTILDSSFTLFIENDQQEENSDLQSTMDFFKLTKEEPIYYCFDIANWAWLGVDPAVAQKELAAVTKYVHLKNYMFVDGHLKTVALEKGVLNPSSLLNGFTRLDMVCLEYEATPLELKKTLERLKGGFWDA